MAIQNLNLLNDEKQRVNQQHLYRLLRKLVKQDQLAKHIHYDNSRLSTFVKTENMCEFRKQFDLVPIKNDSKKTTFKTNQLKRKAQDLRQPNKSF